MQAPCSEFTHRPFVAVAATIREMQLSLWVKKALEHSEMSQAELARQLTLRLRREIDRAAVQKMTIARPKKGQKPRKVIADELLAIEDITGYPIPERTRRVRMANAVGYVGAGAEVIPADDHAIGAGLEEVEIPDNAVWVIVRGDSMYPRYFDNEFLFYIRDQRSPTELVGRECVVQLEDGRMYVKVLRKGVEGRFNLESWNGPTIENKAVEWASPVMGRVNRGGR